MEVWRNLLCKYIKYKCKFNAHDNLYHTDYLPRSGLASTKNYAVTHATVLQYHF